MSVSNVREINLIGQKIAADMAALPEQLAGLIEEFGETSIPLLPGELYSHPVSDRRFQEGTHLLISVRPDGNDATCRRLVVDGPSSLDGEASGSQRRAPIVLSAEGPVYFLSQKGTLERIIYINRRS